MRTGAGKDRGAMVIPEVGDEVLVAFQQHHRPAAVCTRRSIRRDRYAKYQRTRTDRLGIWRRQPAFVRLAERTPDRPFDENGKTEGSRPKPGTES